MKYPFSGLLLASLTLTACSGEPSATAIVKSEAQEKQQASVTETVQPDTTQSVHRPQPASQKDYKITVPEGWKRQDTTLQFIKVCFITPISDLPDEPRVNIVNVSTNGQDIDSFITGKMKSLGAGNKEIIVHERGNIKVGTISARWFTYTKIKNDVAKDMINYIIPYKGTAYLVSAAVKQGTMPKHRQMFDKMVKSFKVQE
jgi:hypothetical protein